MASHKVTLAEASAMTKRFREIPGKNGARFNKDEVMELLEQDGCAFLTYYNGLNDKGEPVLILVATDQNNNDLTDGIILQRVGWPCPPYCPSANPLNS